MIKQIYICDSCGMVIDDPYKVKMKEFYVGYDFDYGMTFPVNSHRKKKVHLCDECYHALKKFAKE